MSSQQSISTISQKVSDLSDDELVVLAAFQMGAVTHQETYGWMLGDRDVTREMLSLADKEVLHFRYKNVWQKGVPIVVEAVYAPNRR